MVDRSTEHGRDEHMRCTLLECTARKCFAATTHKERNEDVDKREENGRIRVTSVICEVVYAFIIIKTKETTNKNSNNRLQCVFFN